VFSNIVFVSILKYFSDVLQKRKSNFHGCVTKQQEGQRSPVVGSITGWNRSVHGSIKKACYSEGRRQVKEQKKITSSNPVSL
jgi:hypothetical protein